MMRRPYSLWKAPLLFLAALIAPTASFALGPVLQTGGAAVIPYPRSNAADLVYSSPSLAFPHFNQRCNVFLPTTPMPDSGYPVLISMQLGGFTGTGLDDFIPSGQGNAEAGLFLWKCLNRGVAVVRCSATVVGQTLEDTPSSPVIPGLGMFYPPAGECNGIKPYSDYKRSFSEKDAVMVVQYVRHNAGTVGHDLEKIDGSKIGVHGISAGAFSMQWVGLQDELRDTTFPLTYLSGRQDSASTIVQAVIVQDGGTFVPAFNQSFGASGHLPESLDSCTQASSLAQVDECLQIAVSAHNYASPAPPPTFMYYTESASSTNYSVSYSAPLGGPCTASPFGVEQNIHTCWSGLSWAASHPAALVLLSDPAFLPPTSMPNVGANTSQAWRTTFMARWVALTL